MFTHQSDHLSCLPNDLKVFEALQDERYVERANCHHVDNVHRFFQEPDRTTQICICIWMALTFVSHIFWIKYQIGIQSKNSNSYYTVSYQSLWISVTSSFIHATQGNSRNNCCMTEHPNIPRRHCFIKILEIWIYWKKYP